MIFDDVFDGNDKNGDNNLGVVDCV